MTTLPSDSMVRVSMALNQIRKDRHNHEACWRKFDDFRKDNILCDVSVRCRDKKYDVHKCVISVASPYFLALFTTQMVVEGDGRTIDLSDYSNNTVETLLDLIYGCADVESADIGELLRLAEFLQYDWLVNALVKSIRPLIDVSNCFAWYETAKTSGVEVLICITKSFIVSSYDELIAMDKYENVAPMIKDIARSMEVDFVKELVIVFHEKDSRNYVINLPDKTIEMRREGPTLTACDSSVQSFFVHKHGLFMISTFNTYERNCPYYTRDYFEQNTKIEIQTYNHCSQTYKLLHYIEPCKLVAKVHTDNTTQHVRPNTPFRISSFAYNGVESLYLVLMDKNDLFTVFKMNLGDGIWAENWITIKPESKDLKICESKHFGSLLIDGLYDAYEMENFPFRKLNDHSPQPLNVSFDWKPIFKKAHRSKSKNRKWNGYWRSWDAVGLKGEVFLFVVFYCDSSNVYVYQLNPEKLSWDEICIINIPHLLHLGKVIVCGEEVYCSIYLQKNSPTDEESGRAIVETHRLYHLDLTRKVCQDTEMDVSVLKESHRYATVPAYFML